MSSHNLRLAAAISAGLVLATSLISYSTGVYPGATGVLGPVLPGVTRGVPFGLGCGQCHGTSIGLSGFSVTTTPAQRSLDLNQSIQVTSTVTGGVVSTLGGFSTETTAGLFSATGQTRTDPSGSYATHVNRNNRTWTYTLTAANTAGPFELWTAGNSVNGSNTALGDIWGFRGFDPTSLTGTPIHMYVNAAGVTAFGNGCVGSFGNHPVLGSSQTPAAGNLSFAFDLAGAAENSQVVLLVGARRSFGLPLDLIGVTGCELWVDSFASLASTTGPGVPQRGEGSVSFGLPLPAGVPVGARISAQAAILDLANGRSVPVTLTHALEVTVQ